MKFHARKTGFLDWKGICVFLALAVTATVQAQNATSEKIAILFTNNTGYSDDQVFISFSGGAGVTLGAGQLGAAGGGSSFTLDLATNYSLAQLKSSVASLGTSGTDSGVMSGLGSQSNVYMDLYTGGRMWVSLGSELTYPNSLYTPSSVTPSDPNFGKIYQYWEPHIGKQVSSTTIDDNNGDISYIDYYSFPISLQAHALDGTAKTSAQQGYLNGGTSEGIYNAVIGSTISGRSNLLPSTTYPVSPGGATDPTRASAPNLIPGSGSPAFPYHDFSGYLQRLATTGATTTVSGTFAGVGPNVPATGPQASQAYNFTVSYHWGSTDAEKYILLTGTSAQVNNGAEFTIKLEWNGATNGFTYLNQQAAIYGANAGYIVDDSSGTSTSNTITNDVYGWVIGDILSGLNFGTIGSTVEFNGQAIGEMNSSEWFASDGPITAGYWGKFAQPDNDDSYNTWAFALNGLQANGSGDPIPGTAATDAYGFPFSDRVGSVLIGYNPDDTSYLEVVLSAPPDAFAVPEPSTYALLGLAAALGLVAWRRKLPVVR